MQMQNEKMEVLKAEQVRAVGGGGSALTPKQKRDAYLKAAMKHFKK